MEMFNCIIQAGNSPEVMDRTVDRIMAAEYNQQVRRGEAQQATRTLARMIGFWLQNRAGR